MFQLFIILQKQLIKIQIKIPVRAPGYARSRPYEAFHPIEARSLRVTIVRDG
jgi:hypothetical protein